MTPRPVLRSLRTALWPVADKAAWEEACRPSVRLRRGGVASHLRSVTQHDLAKRYGRTMSQYLAMDEAVMVNMDGQAYLIEP